MITAEMAKAQSSQASEDFIEQLILKACQNGDYSTNASVAIVPEWLQKRLTERGFKVSVENNVCHINWEG